MNEGKNKKFLLIIALVSFVFAVVIVGVIGAKLGRSAGMMGWRNDSNYGYGQGKMMKRAGYAIPTQIENKDQFILPQDAAKSGELAIVVDGIEAAKKVVADVATQNEGTVYSTFISHSSNEAKNGSMVLQVPVANFDGAFESLKKSAGQIIQESTRQIEKRNFYPMPANIEKGVAEDLKVESDAQENSETAENAKPEIAVYPNPIQDVQDKGYIRVIFADYGSPKVAAYSGNSNIGNMMNNSYATQDVRKVLLVGFAIKLILLLVLIFMLGFVFKKMISHFHLSRKSGLKIRTKLSEKKSVAHVVRQNSRTRVVKR